MKRKLLTLTAVLALLVVAGGCKEKPEPPTPGPGPGPDPGTEITTDNAAPAGFTDEGPMTWDE